MAKSHEFEGFIVKVTRRGEVVEGTLKGSNFGSHYNVDWTNSDGQSFIGSIEDWEMKEAQQKE
jgi:hypothetical protein